MLFLCVLAIFCKLKKWNATNVALARSIVATVGLCSLAVLTVTLFVMDALLHVCHMMVVEHNDICFHVFICTYMYM